MGVVGEQTGRVSFEGLSLNNNANNQASSGSPFIASSPILSKTSEISFPLSDTSNENMSHSTPIQQTSSTLGTGNIAQLGPSYIDSADPEPSTLLIDIDPQRNGASDPVSADSADPEPIGQLYPGSISSIGTAYGNSNALTDSSDPEPAAPAYTSDLDNYILSDSADPEPSAGTFSDAYLQDPNTSGVLSISSDASDPEPTYAINTNDRNYAGQQYDPLASQDASESVLFGSADPEPTSGYLSADSSDPEPTAPYSPYYDDAVADPEPDSVASGYYSDQSVDPEPSAP